MYNIQTLENIKEINYEKKAIVYNDKTELSFELISDIAKQHNEHPTVLWFVNHDNKYTLYSLTVSEKKREKIEFYRSYNKGHIIKESFKSINYE